MEIFFWIVWIAVMAWFSFLNFGPKGRAKRKAAFEAAAAQAEVNRRELEQAGFKPYPEKAKRQLLLFGPIMYAVIGWLVATVFTIDTASSVAIWYTILCIFVGAMIGVFFSAISVGIANTAERKGRSYLSFFMLSLLVSPIVMWIISATMSADSKLSQAVTKGANVAVDSKSTSSKLKELQELRDSGLITQKEFDTKKKSLLENL